MQTMPFGNTDAYTAPFTLAANEIAYIYLKCLTSSAIPGGAGIWLQRLDSNNVPTDEILLNSELPNLEWSAIGTFQLHRPEQTAKLGIDMERTP